MNKIDYLADAMIGLGLLGMLNGFVVLALRRVGIRQMSRGSNPLGTLHYIRVFSYTLNYLTIACTLLSATFIVWIIACFIYFRLLT